MNDDLNDLIAAVGDDFARRSAVRKLSWIVDKRSAEALIKAIQIDDDPKLLEPVREGLKRMGNQNIDLLISALADEKTDVRELIAEVLGYLSDKRAVVSLIGLAQNDRERFVRQAAIEALGNIGDVDAFDILIVSLEDENKFLRWVAVEALGKIGDTRAIEPLIKLLNDEKEVSNAAQESLKKLGYDGK